MKRQSLLRSVLCAFVALIIMVDPVLAQLAPTLPLFGVQVNVPGPMGTQVNTFNGNLYYYRTDLIIPGRGLPLEIRFAYNSGQSNVDDGFGFGWQFSYNLYYIEDGDDIVIHRSDGRMDKYIRSGDTFIKPLGVRDTLEEYAPNQFRLTSPDGIQTFFALDTHRHVTSIWEPNGNTLIFTYNGAGQLATITDTSGRQLVLDYAGDYLTTITDPNTTPSRTIRFQYDGSDNLVSITDLAGKPTTYGYVGHRLASITDRRGHTATISYDTTLDPYQFVVSNISTDLTNRSFDYDEDSRTTTVTDMVDGGDQVTRYVYDNQGRISSIENGLGDSISAAWDGKNNLTSFTDENGRTTSYTYDDNGNILTVTDPLTHTTVYTYDIFNRVTGIRDANGHTTTYEYDANGNLIKITCPLGYETTFSHDANGDLISATDANGHTTTFSYNANGDLTSLEDPLGHTISFTYDNVGNMLTTTDANGHTTTLAYDPLNRLTSVANALGQQTTFTYDANGNQTSVTDAKGHTTEYEYDALNRLVRVTDALGNETNYTYDQVNNLRTIVDAKGHTTTFEYDAVNRLISETDPEGDITVYGYDNADNLINRTDANGQTTTYTYDATDRLTAVDYPNDDDVSYGYDNVGNLTGMSNGEVSVSQSYDAANRPTDIDVNVIAGGFSKSIHYDYDAVGNRTTMTDPDGGVTTYTYNDVDRLFSLVNPSGQMTGYAYNDGDRLIRRDHHNDTQAFYTYDDADQLFSIIHKDSAGTTLFGHIYQYDEAGNRIRMTDAAGDIDDNGNLTTVTDYTYDDLDRLTGVTYPDGTTVSYAYDGVGNRTQLVDGSGTTDYTYDDANRLLSAGGTTYSWDNNGNQISKVAGGNTTAYTYDDENRLINIAFFPGEISKSFTYYPDGRRLSTTERVGTTGTTTYHFYDGLNTLTETDSSGTTVARYTSGLGIDRWISMERGGATHHYHRDGLDSIIGLTDAGASIAATYQYDAFGTTTSETGSLVNPFRYTGRQLEAESGLYDYRSRFYDSKVGRFLSRDLFPGILEAPNTLHPYTYVDNNPIVYTDPLGRSSSE